MLKEGLTENKDYMLVSEQVWQYLTNIYDGRPEFCRTGKDSIELYPKMVHLYPSLLQGQIDYSSDMLREASGKMEIGMLMKKSCEISDDKLKDYRIFFKTCEMTAWEEVKDASVSLGELSSLVIIYVVCLPKKESDVFLKNHQKTPTTVTEVNLGDSLVYRDKIKGHKKAIFLGKNIEGKFMLHFDGEPYSNDICLLEHELVKKCKL